MTWTTPKTWVANTQVTEGALNAHLRDNLLETLPAKAVTEGDIFVATGLNAVAARSLAIATVATSETTASALFTELTTTGPNVTAVTGVRAIVIFGCTVGTNSDAMTVVPATAFSDTVVERWAFIYGSQRGATSPFRGMSAHMFTDLVPGSNTFRSKYRNGTFSERFLIVVPL